MNKLKNTVQRAKGKLQQVEGEIQQESGHGIKGGWTKLKGKAKEWAADTKDKVEDINE